MRLGRLALCIGIWAGCSFPGILTLRAQTHQLDVGIGALNNMAKDRLAAPVRYSGRGAPFSLGYVVRSGRHAHNARAIFSKTGFVGNALDRNDGVSFGEAHYILGQLEYAYEHRLAIRGPSALDLWVGPVWHSTIHVREYFYTPENSEISWDVFSALGVQIRGGYALHQGRLEGVFWIPVLSYVNRPPYAVEGDDVFYALFKRTEFFKLGRFVLLNRFTLLSSGISYTWRFTSTVGARAGYHLLMYRYGEPLTTASVLSEIRLSLIVEL